MGTAGPVPPRLQICRRGCDPGDRNRVCGEEKEREESQELAGPHHVKKGLSDPAAEPLKNLSEVRIQYEPYYQPDKNVAYTDSAAVYFQK